VGRGPWAVENGKWKMENEMFAKRLLPVAYCLILNFEH
jgi:hypothetical protein